MANKRNPKMHEEIKQLIIDHTKEIIEKEGLEGVSIRKITRSIGYSPGIVYHYFADKDEIINYIFRLGYNNIINSVKNAIESEGPADEVLRQAMEAYIKAVKDNSLEYKEIMTSSNPIIQEKTRILYKNACSSNPALKLLKENLEKGIHDNIYKAMDTDISAQIIWTTLFGFALKVTIEEVEEEYMYQLMGQLFDTILSSIKV